MEIIPLNWDSEFFMLRIAKAVVATYEDITELSKRTEELQALFDLVYVFSEPGLEIPMDNAWLVDKKAIYTIDSPMHYEVDNNIKCWEQLEATESLISLALVSGKYSRFKVDSHFPFGSYERLYTQWINQSVNKSIATEVFCYMIDGDPRGLLTLNRRNGRNIIGLVAVDDDYQHCGIGTALIKYAISFVHGLNGGQISVTTQLDNEPACQLYSKCGFALESVKWIWHWWL